MTLLKVIALSILFKNLTQTWYTYYLEILKKKKKSSEKKKKKSSENDQLTGHFQSFFIYFFRPHDPKSEKISRKSTIKKILALHMY